MKPYILFLSLIFSLILISCEEETETKIENENIPLLSKEIYGDDLFFEYTYNENNLLKERKTKWSYTSYSYNSDNQLLSYDMYEDLRIASSDWETLQQAMNRTDWVTPENTEISGRGTYSYSHDKLTKITVTRFPGGNKTNVTFEYDEEGRIGKKIFCNDNIPDSFIEYDYDEKGNLVFETHKDIVDGNPVISITEEYEFDGKNNPYKVFKRLLLPGEYTNENNIIRKTMTLFFDVSGVDKVQVTESSYEYNLQSYPVKKNGMIRYEYK